MKKIYLALIAFILVVPCSAQAYYIQYATGFTTGTVAASTPSNELSLDASSYMAPLQVTGAFTIYSDYGTDIVRDVDVSFSHYLTTVSPAPVTATLSLSGNTILSTSYFTPGGLATALAAATASLKTATSYIFSYTMDAIILSDSDLTIAVTSTDAPTATPIPGAVWLLGTGIAGLFGIRRKRQMN